VVEVAVIWLTFIVEVETSEFIAENAASCPGVPVAFTMNPADEPDEEMVIGAPPIAVNDVHEVEPEQDTEVVATEPRVAG
jgi:hypothetical protein